VTARLRLTPSSAGQLRQARCPADASFLHCHTSGRFDLISQGDEEDVIAEINPTWEDSAYPTWEDSASGKRILAFRSGGFYCREHECTIDPLRLVALEAELIDACDDVLSGEAFKQAYHIAREEYGAPFPSGQ